MWSPSVAVGAGIANRSHYILQGSQAGFRRFAGKRVPPSFLAGMVPGFRIDLVFAVAVIAAFCHGVIFDQDSKSPAFKGSVSWPVRVWRCFLLCVASHGRLESVGLISYTTAVNPTAFPTTYARCSGGEPTAQSRERNRSTGGSEAVQDGRIYIALINGPMLFDLKATPAEYSPGLKLAIERGWIAMHESGTYVKFTQAGAELFA
jgi:hypothetical protein